MPKWPALFWFGSIWPGNRLHVVRVTLWHHLCRPNLHLSTSSRHSLTTPAPAIANLCCPHRTPDPTRPKHRLCPWRTRNQQDVLLSGHAPCRGKAGKCTGRLFCAVYMVFDSTGCCALYGSRCDTAFYASRGWMWPGVLNAAPWINRVVPNRAAEESINPP